MPKLTARRLRELLSYDPKTGAWVRLTPRGRHGRHKAGASAGHVNPSGYRSIRIDGKLYLAHRLAWLYMKGRWPKNQIDHKNKMAGDDRWENLRDATHGQNVQNSTARKSNKIGLKGVSVQSSKYQLKKKFRARIIANGKEYNLGLFETANQAHETYISAAKRLHKEFARS